MNQSKSKVLKSTWNPQENGIASHWLKNWGEKLGVGQSLDQSDYPIITFERQLEAIMKTQIQQVTLT